MRLSSIMICCCCSAESRVQRPWRIRSTMLRTEGLRLVKGAATLASPGRTKGRSESAPSSAVILARASFCASYTLPCRAWRRRRSSLSSLRMRLVTCLRISTCAQTPFSRPCCARASRASWIHRAWLAWSSFCLALRAARCSCAATAALRASSMVCRLSASSALAAPGPSATSPPCWPSAGPGRCPSAPLASPPEVFWSP
mmetsp:Transcript_2395/g.7004  ORF Transcript_2395/g.7004 Transcript_2395/m.7004 type:complete len:200 (+) Transcript_2395:1141-1740(+)